MKLFHKRYSQTGQPLVILHGLLGNHANWSWHAHELARDYQVVTMDLRNHGRSAWSEEHTYQLMAQDVLETMDELGLPQAHFIGHSMGGKVAMQVAFLAAPRVRRLLIVDIAPVDYPGQDFAPVDYPGQDFAPVDYPGQDFAPLQGLLAIDTANLTSRRAADESLAGYVEDKAVRDFLLTNLQRDEQGGYSWRCNLQVLARCYAQIRAKPDPAGRFAGDTLFIKGGKSEYLREAYGEEIMRLFPAARFRIIANAGHWVHSEKPQDMVRIARDFLAGPDA